MGAALSGAAPVPTAAAVHAKAVEHTDEAATEDEVAA